MLESQKEEITLEAKEEEAGYEGHEEAFYDVGLIRNCIFLFKQLSKINHSDKFVDSVQVVLYNL